MNRNLDYEKKFKAYLFKGNRERAKEILNNINIKGVGLNE